MARSFKENKEVIAALAEVVEVASKRLKDGFQFWKDAPAFVGLVTKKSVRKALKGINNVGREWRKRKPSEIARYLSHVCNVAAESLEKQGQ